MHIEASLILGTDYYRVSRLCFVSIIKTKNNSVTKQYPIVVKLFVTIIAFVIFNAPKICPNVVGLSFGHFVNLLFVKWRSLTLTAYEANN